MYYMYHVNWYVSVLSELWNLFKSILILLNIKYK